MPENKNQSARWPSVGGSSVTGRINLQSYNPEERRRALIADLRKQKFAGEMSLNDQLARIQQNIAAGSITAQERLMASRQANLNRMMQLYGNYFQQFGNVLNKEALDFLDKHSNIGVPTLTAIMAGYEHARTSRAEQELAMLDRQAKLMQSAEVLETERAKLAEEKAKNDTAVLQSNLAQAAKSYSDYMGGLISDAGGGTGRAGGRGTGGVGAGMTGGSAAKGYDEGGANVVGGARTGTPGSSGQQSASASEGAVDTKAEQTGVQGAQLGPNTQQAVDIDNQITEWSDLSGTPLFAGAVGATGVGWALNKYGNRASLGYIKPSELARYNQARGLVSQINTALNSTGYDAARMQVQADLAGSNLYNKAGGDLNRYIRIIEQRDALRTRLANKGLTGTLTPREQRILTSLTPNVYELESLKNIQDMKNIKSNYYDPLTTQKTILENQLKTATTDNIKAYNKAGNFARIRGSVARGAGKLAGYATKGLWAASMIDLASSFADEGVGIVAGATTWAKNTLQDLSGVTRQRLAEDPDYLRNRPTPTQVGQAASRYVLAAKNNFFNMAGMNTNLGNDIANMTVDRLRALGYDPANIEISQIIDNSKRNPQDSANALEFLMSVQSDGNGNIAGTSDSIIKYYNDVLRDSAYQRTYAAQANKIAQDRQISEQQMMQEQRNAMLAEGLSRTEQGIAQQIYDYAAANGEEVDFEDILAVAHLFHDEVMAGESGGRHGIEGDMTSDGTAKSAYQIKDKTFQWFQKALLQDDDRSGGQLLNPQQRELLRTANNANDLDRDEIGQLVLRAFPLYHLWKENINIGKFGKGNPNISAIDAFIEVAKIHRNMGRQGNPYVIGNLDALRRAVHGRFFDTEENRKAVANMDLRLQNNFQTPQGWWSQRNGAFMMSNDVSNAMQQVRPQIAMSQYIKKSNDNVDFDNLNPIIKRQLNALAEELGQHQGSIQLNSGTRDKGRNDFMIKMYKEGRGKEFGIAYEPSKNSKHLTGDAIDVQIDQLDKFVKGNEELKNKYKDGLGMMASYGFDNSVKGDDVHFTLNKKFAEQPALSVPQFKQYMIPIESTYSEPPPQTVVAQNPWGVDFLDQYIGQPVEEPVEQATDWEEAMRQMNQ